MLSSPSSAPLPPLGGDAACKRKRRSAGTPDPDAEVVSLSPGTLLESDRYVCEICGQGFQRDQNLQMHRRRHKVPWKLLKREINGAEVRKRVFVCPEPSCLHHDPTHALGDLVGIKKHYRRKHSSNRQWVCDKCSKAYAVQSDYKAHLKTCGTRRQPPCLSRTASSPSPSSDTNITTLQLSLGPNTTRDLGKVEARERLRLAAAEKALADEARMQARKQKEMAEQELAGARTIRQRAEAELSRAIVMRDHAAKRVSSALLEITCQSCKRLFHAKNPPVPADHDQSLAASYMSSVVTEGDDDQHHHLLTDSYT